MPRTNTLAYNENS